MLQLRHKRDRFIERTVIAAGLFSIRSASDCANAGRFIFVCTGNICRSPFAEAFGRVHGIPSISCGIETGTNLPADPQAIAEAARRGIDLRSHTTTRWLDVELEPTDVVVAMQLVHARIVWRRANSAGCRVLLMSSLLGPNYPTIWDPYGLGPEAQASAYDKIERAVTRIRDLRHLGAGGGDRC